jgi:DnaK suppressor protein
MSKTNMKGCRRILEAKRRELLSTHHETEGLAVQRVSDSMEELGLEVQRHMAVEALNRKRAVLCQVTEALERIAAGKYGLCLVCHNPISPKRLAALPWAALCIECQQAAENRLDIEAQASVGQQHGYSMRNDGEQLAGAAPGHHRRWRRRVIPRPLTNRATIKSRAGL